MSDKFPPGEPSPDKDIPDKRAIAAKLADAAREAEAAGDTARADALMAQATDPEGSVAVPGGADEAPASDEEVAAILRTVEPGHDAPSRAGITGSGSGADSM